MEPLLIAASGAIGAAFLGLLGAWVQSLREHKRWIREQRLAIYSEVIALAHDLHVQTEFFYFQHPEGLQPLHEDGTRFLDPPLAKYVESWPSAFATLTLLGPSKVKKLANVLSSVATQADSPDHTEKYYRALEDFSSAARRAMRIKDR
jgi:hypothetical protein